MFNNFEIPELLTVHPFFSAEFNLEAYENEEDDGLERYLLHMDVDYFFAQVELLGNPELNGLPLIVGNPNARQTGRGVVLTCTYEARTFGIRSGMAMNEALKRCPEATIVSPSQGVYGKISTSIMNILQSYGLPMRKAGSDEAYIDITPIIDRNKKSFPQINSFAKDLKSRIFKQEKLTVSVGIGPTLKIAKIGSDYQKPDGITIVDQSSLKSFFDKITLIKIPGIGGKTAAVLKRKGFEHCRDLINRSEDHLIELFGSWGEYLFKVFRGETTNRIRARGERKSVSHSRTFIGKPHDIQKYTEVLDNLFDSSYEGLINAGFHTKTVDLRIRFNDFHTITRSKSLPAVTQSRELLYQVTYEVVKTYFTDDRGIRLLGIGFSNLEKLDEAQTDLNDFF